MSTKKLKLDIQGLRALAVLAVVIFHIDPVRFTGGFLGVDIFFVISGYLIIGIIWRDLEKGSFSLVDFYLRRIKRLFPAYFVTTIFCIICVLFVFLPGEIKSFSESLISSVFYVSNIYFFSESSYFDDSLKYAPLLHTWSLSVEEQFYLVFPVILMGVNAKFRQKGIAFLILCTLVALVFSIAATYINQSFAFFMSPARFWQFLIGGVVAIYLDKKHVPFIKYLGDIAFVILLVCLLVYDKNLMYPGYYAIIPTLATALVIASGKYQSICSRLLSIKPGVLVGNASYSIYLWHWPIIVFYKIGVHSKIVHIEALSLLLSSLVLGFFSWKYIELPFVKKNAFKNNTQLLKRFSVFVSILFCLGIYGTTGINFRFSQEQLRTADYLSYESPNHRLGQCFIIGNQDKFEDFDKNLCIKTNTDKPNLLLIGDSHGAHWYSAFNNFYGDSFNVSQVTATGCKPLIDYIGLPECSALLNWGLTELVTDQFFDYIVISSRWRDKDLEELKSTVDQLYSNAGQVIVLGPIIEYQLALPRILAMNDDKKVIDSYRIYDKIIDIDNRFNEVIDKRQENVSYVSIANLICQSEELCNIRTKQNIPIQFDYGHLTDEGALSLLKEAERRNIDIISKNSK